MSPDREWVQGDELPRFVYQALDEEGQPIDLTGATVVFRLTKSDDTAAVPVVVTGALDSAELGIVSAPPPPGATPAGDYNAEFVVTIGSDDRTFPPDRPLRVVIRPRV